MANAHLVSPLTGSLNVLYCQIAICAFGKATTDLDYLLPSYVESLKNRSIAPLT
jgi:hypothetical protein